MALQRSNAHNAHKKSNRNLNKVYSGEEFAHTQEFEHNNSHLFIWKDSFQMLAIVSPKEKSRLAIKGHNEKQSCRTWMFYIWVQFPLENHTRYKFFKQKAGLIYVVSGFIN